MKYLLLTIIKLYWRVPVKYRRNCLFKESCSKYVYRITLNQGFKKGILALKKRVHQCRPGYCFFSVNGDEMVLLKDKTVINRGETIV